MAALFKVARHDKLTERKIVKAASMDELIAIAKVKLKLSSENYKLYADDLTEIDEDEILMDLAKAKGNDQLLLTIVPGEVSWDGNILLENTHASSTGKHLHDDDNSYHVVINKQIMIKASSFTDGILTTFLCYYVFGIVYPPQIEGTLEGIQLLFLEICPPKGTKRGEKRKPTNIHPKVSKLIKAIDQYMVDEEI